MIGLVWSQQRDELAGQPVKNTAILCLSSPSSSDSSPRGCVSAFRATHLDWALPGKDLEPKNSSPDQLDDWATHFANTLYDRVRPAGLSECSYIFPQYRALHSRRCLSPFAVWSDHHAGSAISPARVRHL